MCLEQLALIVWCEQFPSKHMAVAGTSAEPDQPELLTLATMTLDDTHNPELWPATCLHIAGH